MSAQPEGANTLSPLQTAHNALAWLAQSSFQCKRGEKALLSLPKPRLGFPGLPLNSFLPQVPLCRGCSEPTRGTQTRMGAQHLWGRCPGACPGLILRRSLHVLCSGVLWKGSQLLKGPEPSPNRKPLRPWSTDPAQGHSSFLADKHLEPESRAPRRGRTDRRQGQQTPGAAQNLCPGPSRAGLPFPYSFGDRGTSPAPGGAALGICPSHGDITA